MVWPIRLLYGLVLSFSKNGNGLSNYRLFLIFMIMSFGLMLFVTFNNIFDMMQMMKTWKYQLEYP